MSKVFDDMDRLAAARFPIPETETSKARVLSAEELEKLFNHGATEALSPIEPLHNNRETFASGAVRNKVDYRYDLMSPMVADLLLADSLHMTTPRQELALYLLGKNEHSPAVISEYLADVVGTNRPTLAHLYAQALHEGASKYGERNWEKGLPKSNLINHALHHLFKLVEGDTSENHASHLVWNVMTIIHFREVNARAKEDTV